MEPITIAEFWDCELEHSEAKRSWVNEHLLQVIRRTLGTNAPRKLDVEAELRRMAESQAFKTEWATNDKILTFEDCSRLALVAMDANTMKGSSRVMAPGEQNVRAKVRNGKPYIHGKTKTPWYWTRNGKTYGKTLPPTATTGDDCPKSGHWVRRFCNNGCADYEVPPMIPIAEGALIGECTTCRSNAVWGWATP